MTIRVLGPLDIGEETLGARERALLSALIVRRGSTIAPAELADAWWGEAVPATWAQQIRNGVARIRKRLGHGAVETVAADYRLGVDGESIDAVRFERLVSEARAHALQGENDRAVDLYRRALALWRGAPLPDVARWAPGASEAMRLTEIHASAQEELLDERLKAGEHRSLIPDAERLVRDEPLREARWAILALANYRAERQAEALATLRAARARLADELAIEPGPRLVSLETAMLRQDPALAAPTVLPSASADCPYPGLRSFGPDDASVFFGRDADIDAVLARVQPGAVIVLAGPSGSGKSSLALGGVAPRLQAAGTTFLAMHPGREAALLLRSAGARAAVVIVDQAEELLVLPQADLDAFAHAAAGLLQDGRTLVLTARSDALDRLRALPHVGDAIGRGVYLVGPLSADGCREAVQGPAREAGLRLQPGLVELAVRDLGDRVSTLPHLSHALRETWVRREGITLTVDGYETSGGIAGAIARSAEEAFRSIPPADQDVCRSLMLRLVERGDDGISTRRRVPSAPLFAQPERRRVVEALARARLVSVDHDTVMIAHEAVASAWPRLDQWLDDDVERSRTTRSVEAAAAAWDASGRSPDDLLRGARLQLVLSWRDRATLDLTPIEAEFVDASEARERSELQQVEARATQERSRNRVLRAALGIAAGLLVAALAAGGIAVVRGQESAAFAQDARIGAITATALALRTTDRDLSALLAAAAFRRWGDEPRVRSALLGVASGAAGLTWKRVAGDAARTAVQPIPGSDRALQIVDDDAGSIVSIVDPATGETMRTLDVDLQARNSEYTREIAISDDGRIASIQTPVWRDPADAATCCDNAFTFVDLETGRTLPGSQLLEMRTSAAVDLGADGSRAFFAHPIVPAVVSIDVHTGQVAASDPAAFTENEGNGVYAAVTGVDADRVAIGADDAVRVFRRGDLVELASLPLPEGTADAALALDGAGGFLSAGESGIVRVDGATGEILWSRPTDLICWGLLVVAPRGVFYCSALGAVIEYDLEDGMPSGRSFATELDGVIDIASISGGRSVLMDSQLQAMAYAWSPDGAGPASHFAAEGRQAVAAVSDTVAVTIPADGGPGAQLWDVAADEPIGAPSDWIEAVGDDVVVRWSGDQAELEDLVSGERIPLDLADDLGAEPSAVRVDAGGSGPHAFAVAGDRMLPFDPATGLPTGPAVRLTTPQLQDHALSVTEAPDATRAVVTYYEPSSRLTVTAVVELATGTVIVSEPIDADSSVWAPSGELLTAIDDRLEERDPDTLASVRSLSKPSGGSRTLSAASDGHTVLNTGFTNRMTLFDLATGTRLGDPILADPAPMLDVPAGALSPTGEVMLVNITDGIHVWSLDSASLYDAACAIAGREFTEAEWSTYLRDLGDQRATCEG